MKEANEEIQNRYCDLERSKLSDYFSVSNKFIEKELFTNIKNIKENHLKRSKEIDENYEIIFKFHVPIWEGRSILWGMGIHFVHRFRVKVGTNVGD